MVLYDTIVSPMVLLVMLQAPGCLVNLIVLVFKGNSGNDLFQMISSNALIFFAFMNSFLISDAVNQVTEEVNIYHVVKCRNG